MSTRKQTNEELHNDKQSVVTAVQEQPHSSSSNASQICQIGNDRISGYSGERRHVDTTKTDEHTGDTIKTDEDMGERRHNVETDFNEKTDGTSEHTGELTRHNKVNTDTNEKTDGTSEHTGEFTRHNKVNTDTNEKTDSSDESPTGLLDDPTLFPEGGIKAYTMLFGSFLGLTGTLAFVNSAGVTENYVKEHILTDLPTTSVAWIFSIYNFMQFGMTIVSGPAFDHLGARVPIFFGTALFIIGVMCMSVSTELYQFILSFSVVAGLGNAFTFGPFVAVISHYFYLRRGIAVGLAYIGGGLGGVIMPLIFRSLFPKVGFGWTIRIGGFVCLVLLLAGCALVTDRRHIFQPVKQCNSNDEEADSSTDLQQSKENTQTTTKAKKNSIIWEIFASIDLRAFEDPVFATLVFALLGNGFAFLVTSTYLPSYAVACGYPSSQAYLLLTIFNSLSIPGRLLPGFLADRFGAFNVLCCISLMCTLSILIIWLPNPIGHKLGGLYAFAAVYGFSSGSILSLTPTAVGIISQTKDFGKRCGTAFFVLSFGDLFGIVIGGAIIGDGKLRYFDHLVIFVFLCSFVATTCVVVSRVLFAGFKFVKA